MTREAFENAITVVMAVGGSTNAVLHLLAMAHEAEPVFAVEIGKPPGSSCGIKVHQGVFS